MHFLEGYSQGTAPVAQDRLLTYGVVPRLSLRPPNLPCAAQPHALLMLTLVHLFSY